MILTILNQFYLKIHKSFLVNCQSDIYFFPDSRRTPGPPIQRIFCFLGPTFNYRPDLPAYFCGVWGHSIPQVPTYFVLNVWCHSWASSDPKRVVRCPWDLWGCPRGPRNEHKAWFTLSSPHPQGNKNLLFSVRIQSVPAPHPHRTRSRSASAPHPQSASVPQSVRIRTVNKKYF